MNDLITSLRNLDLSKATLQEKLELEKLLTIKVKDKEENRLDYMQWHLYQEQDDMMNAAIARLTVREGPNIFVILGGNRSGKSELGGGIIANAFKIFGRLRIWCATLSDLSVKVQQRKIFEIARKKDIVYGSYDEVNGWKRKTIISKKKSVIYFKTYEQGTGAFQGDDVDIIWLDEEPPYDVFSEALVRLADRSGIMVVTFTSLMGFTKVVNRLWKSKDPNVVATTLTPAKNPFLTKNAKKQLFQNIDPDELKSRWEGQPHLKEGLIYKEFCEEHKIPRFDYKRMVSEHPKRYKIHEGIDPHDRTPHHWLRFMYDIEEDIVYIVEELKAPHESMVINEFSKLIKIIRGFVYQSKKIKSIPEICQIDTSSQKPIPMAKHADEYQQDIHTIRTEFDEAGIETQLCTKDNSIGINSVKERLRIIRNKDGEMLQKPKIYVFNDCEGVCWEWTRYSWGSYSSSKTSEAKELINAPKKKDDHFMDIIKYEAIYLKGYYDEEQEEVYDKQDLIYHNSMYAIK